MGIKKNTADPAWHARIFLCLAVVISYASVWPNGFVFDDMPLIVGNELLKHWSDLLKLLTMVKLEGATIVGFCRPVQMLVYFLIYQAFGPSTIAFHALNVVLQVLNACLLNHFGLRAGFKKGAAFAAALLWAVHPLHTIDVAYMSSTAELLAGTFCLLGLIALLPDFAPRKIGHALIFFILALGCKESAVVFPALAALTFFFVSKERTKPAAYLKTWPLWLLSAFYIAIWLWFIHKSGYSQDKSGDPKWFAYYTSSFINRVVTCLATLPVYARLIFWPAGLHIERIFPTFLTLWLWQPMVGMLMVGLGFLQILWGRARRGLALSFGLLWFAAALSPYTGIILPIDALISEGWMYIPTMGLFLGGVQTVAAFFEKRQKAAQLFVLALAFLLGLATFFQNGVWRNTGTLYQSILQNGGYVERLGSHLGLFYMEQGEFDKAIERFQYEVAHPDGRSRILQADLHWKLAMAWLHIPPAKSYTFTLDASTLSSCRHIPEVIGELGKVLQDNPNYYWAHIVLAAIYRYQGDNIMADFHDRQVQEILQKQGS